MLGIHCYASFPLQWLLLLWSIDSRVHGLQQLQLPSSRAQAQELWCLALVALLHMGSFRIRDQTHVSPALSRRSFTTGPPGKSQEVASCWGLICISLETNDVEVFSGTYLTLKSFQQSFCSNLLPTTVKVDCFLSFFYFLAPLDGLWDLSSSTRDLTRPLALRAGSHNHWTSMA